MNLSIWLRTGSLGLMAVSLAGCSALFGQEGYFRDRGDDYLKSDTLPEMQIPEGVEAKETTQLYTIPAAANPDQEAPEEFEVPRPEVLADSAFTDKVKIQKLGKRRWILVSASPAEVWPQVRGFLSQNNLDVSYTDATTGIIESGWLKFKDDETFQDKYRIQIEQGIQPETTEIHVRHIKVERDQPLPDPIEWPEESIDSERESWMVDELAGVIASDTSSGQAASLLAQTIGLSDKVELTKSGKESILRLNLERERVYATVGHSLTQGGFSLWEQDNGKGVFYVNYQPGKEQVEEEPGFWGKLFGADADTEATPSYPLAELLEHLQAEDRRVLLGQDAGIAETSQRLADANGYLVFLSQNVQAGNAIEVRIRDAYGQQLPDKQARKLLQVVRQNLI